MIKIISFTVGILFVALLVCPASHAKESEFIGMQRHKNWTSFVLLGQKYIYAKMVTQGVNDTEDTTLSIETTPDACGMPLIRIALCNDKTKGRNFQTTTSGSIRVDTRSIFDVEYMVSASNGCLSIYPLSRATPTIFKDLAAGNTVRFKINSLSSDSVQAPIYKKYSLIGFSAAFARVQKICTEIHNFINEKNDERFFDERPLPTPQTPPSPQQKTKDDSQYFI